MSLQDIWGLSFHDRIVVVYIVDALYNDCAKVMHKRYKGDINITSNNMNDLDILRKKKLEELKTRYMNGGSKMEENMPNTPLQVTDADIETHIKKYQTLVVDCWAPWWPCGHRGREPMPRRRSRQPVSRPAPAWLSSSTTSAGIWRRCSSWWRCASI